MSLGKRRRKEGGLLQSTGRKKRKIVGTT